MWAWSGVSRWCIRFHPCPVSVCVSDQGKMFQPLWLSCDVVAVHSMFRVVLQQFEKVMVVEMKMVSSFLFIFRLQRSSDEGVVEVKLISGVVCSRFCALALGFGSCHRE
ncbi:hypothetical protein F2Q69_00053889 [Brassica cretica]|uniref:Uncharacterized protein n=1 Tax=Brassica cretica TaxID=69181 RepID=A0A8S9N3Q1_BRACR|nr:hypothetical protein F2Q69_00053889 [Brassica cretica]